LASWNLRISHLACANVSVRIAERSALVPNVFHALTGHPAELWAFLDFHDAVMKSQDL